MAQPGISGTTALAGYLTTPVNHLMAGWLRIALSQIHYAGLSSQDPYRCEITLGADNMASVPGNLDHILLGAADLQHGITWIEQRSGVRAIFGGVHPGRGTRNALLSLGPRRYLEIIAPDPQQTSSTGAGNDMADRLRAIRQPRLIGWAAHTDDLSTLMQKAAAAGIAVENARDSSRVRPDGKRLLWRSFALKNDFKGVLPFFIEWNRSSIHPAQDAPLGCTLQHFVIESPDMKDVRSVAAKLGLDPELRPAKTSVLRARIVGKKGAFEI